MISFDELITESTPEQVEESILSLIETTGLPARSWPKGRTLRVIIAVIATIFAGFTKIMVSVARAGFLDYSTAGWLTLLARYVYNVERREATFATGTVRLDNPAAGIFAKGIGEMKVRAPGTNKVYTNTVAFSLSAGQLGLFVPVQSEERGSRASAATNAVTEIVTSMLGVLVSNPEPIVGADEESDTDLRKACRDAISARSPNGPRSAFSYFAGRAKRLDGTPVNINRVTVARDSSIAQVRVWVASPAGAPAPTDVTACFDACVANCLTDATDLLLAGATPVTLSLPAVTVWARAEAGGTAAEIKAAAEKALIKLQESYPIGGIKKVIAGTGYMFADSLSAAIVSSHPAIFDVDGIGADLALADGQVATISATISVTIVSGVV